MSTVFKESGYEDPGSRRVTTRQKDGAAYRADFVVQLPGFVWKKVTEVK